MSKIITHILTTTAIITTTGVSAFAASPMLEKIDTNKDGLIQKAEFTNFADQKFAAMDADGNGLVTKEERQVQRKAQRELMGETHAKAKFAKLDSDSDGAVSEAEFMAARDARMERMQERRDVNGDGQVDQADKMARKAMHKKMHKKMKARKSAYKGNKHAGGRPEIDTNGDGAVDLAEHQAATIARFARMDKDADGVLSSDELHSPMGMRGKHHGKKQHGQKHRDMRQ